MIDQTVRLTPPMFFAYNVVLLLSPCDGRMAYDDFIVEYQRRTGSTHLLYPTDYGFPTMPRLFDAIQLVAQVRGRRNFKIIILNPEFRRMLFRSSVVNFRKEIVFLNFSRRIYSTNTFYTIHDTILIFVSILVLTHHMHTTSFFILSSCYCDIGKKFT